MQLELEKLRLEWETDFSGGEGEEANQPESARVVFEVQDSVNFPILLKEKITLS